MRLNPPVLPLLLSFALGFAFCTEAKAQKELVTYPDCLWVSADWADGDSFAGKFPDGKTHVRRLYFVDCIETSASTTSDKRRLREQARYFGTEDIRAVVTYGENAARFTAERSLPLLLQS